MSTSLTAIQQKYAEHAALVEQLQGIDYIPHSFKANQARIDHIKKELVQRKQNVQALEAKSKLEYKDVKDLQRSGTRRLYLRVTEGKDALQKKKMKEEQEWLDAVQAESNEKLAIKTLEEELASAEATVPKLKESMENHEKVRKRLDQLYHELFGGTTADYPEEDSAEEAVKGAEKLYAEAQGKLTKESEVNSWLVKAERSMAKVLEKMYKAEDISIKELAASHHLYDMLEAGELRSAKTHSLQVETYVQEARRLQPDILDLGQISIPMQDNGTPLQFGAQQARASDLILTFTNAADFQELQIHRTINYAVKEAVRYSAKLEAETSRSKDRMIKLSQAALDKAANLASKRDALETIRRKIFEEVHKGILPNQAWVPMSFPDTGTDVGPDFPIRLPVQPKGNYPAGGFRSREGTIAVAEAPTSPGGPKFPDTPAFQPQVAGFGRTVPGFRGAPEMGVIASIAAISFPTPVAWALNPAVAGVLLNAMNENIDELRDGEVKMPFAVGAPGQPELPKSPTLPNDPSAKAETSPLVNVSKEDIPKWPEISDKEEVLYNGRGRLFRFIATPPSWEVSGAGEIRLITEKEAKKARIVMRQDATSQVFTEHELTSDMRLLPSLGSDRSFVWNIVANESIAMRFPSAEDAKNFQAAFEKAQIAYPGAVQSPTLTSPTMPFGPGDVVQSPVSMPSAPGMPQWPASPADTTKPPVGGSAADLVKPVAALSIHKKGTTSIDTKQEGEKKA